tara:strand:- start:123 stop:353 length:231 start_codon:yes stop_codon:yes gene_type:complete
MAYLNSPCKGICHTRKFDGVWMCCGCLRYPKEVEEWFHMTDDQRNQVLKALPHRSPKQWRLMNPDREFPADDNVKV